MHKICTKIKYYALTLFLFILLLSSAQAAGILWGVNGHPSRKSVYGDYEKQFQIMHQNHLTTYRMDVNLTEDSQAQEIVIMRTLIPLAHKYGIILRPVILPPFQYGDRTDSGHYPAGDQQALYQQAFTRTYDFVRLFKNDIQDWEMVNEVNLLAKNARGEPMFGSGWTAKEFDMPAMQDWSFVLKGISDAIGKINSEGGVKLRRILGTTSTNFGFLDYMQAHGVNYEVISYHYYVPLGDSPYKTWSKATPRFDLFQKLAGYGKPIHFNEVNASEIYDKAYGNKDSDPLTQKGYKSLSDSLTYLKNQKDVNLEEVDVYELLDEPAQKEPENRFGLMYDLNSPKADLATVSTIAADPAR